VGDFNFTTVLPSVATKYQQAIRRDRHSNETNPEYKWVACGWMKIKKIGIGRANSTYRAKKGAYRVLVGTPEGRIQFGNLRVKRRVIIKWIFKE
jgi:hypothetical protein